MNKPWNWCYKCKQLVDIDDNTADGCIVRCWGCRRKFVVTYYTNDKWALLPLPNKYQNKTKQLKEVL